jgi:hypothetical protein
VSQPLSYARGIPSASDALAFRRARAIYVAGVVLIWLAIFFIVPIGLHQCTDGQAENEALVTMRMKVIGGAAAAWIVMGAARLIRSSLGRRSWLVWTAFAANLCVVALSAANWLGY